MTPFEAAVAWVPGCGAGEAVPRLQPLTGGLSNRAFRVTSAAGDFVLRLGPPLPEAQRLGVDRDAEIAAQRAAAAGGIAPQLVLADPVAGILVMEYVAGEAPPPGWSGDAGWRTGFAALLAALRRLPVPPQVPPVSLPSRLLELHARLRALDPGAAAALAGAVEDGLRGWHAAGAGAGEACLVHSDPNPANVLRRPDGRLMLLDWEYAHAGDPLEDPAAIAADGRLAAELLAGIAGVEPQRLAGVGRCQAALARVWAGLQAAATGAAGGA